METKTKPNKSLSKHRKRRTTQPNLSTQGDFKNSNTANTNGNNGNNKKNNKNGINGINGTANGLTKRQEAFVQEYLIDLNATQAAIRAGYNKNSAPVVACENLKKPNIQEAIQAEMERRADRTRVTQDKVVKELAKIAFSNMKSFVEWGPGKVKLIDSGRISDDDAACVSEVSMTETSTGSTVRFKLYDKKAALELLGRHLGMFMDTLKHVGGDGGPVLHDHKFDFSDRSIKTAFAALYGSKEKEKEAGEKK